MRHQAAGLSATVSYGNWAPLTANNTVVSGDVFVRAGDKFALTLDAKTFLDKPYDIY